MKKAFVIGTLFFGWSVLLYPSFAEAQDSHWGGTFSFVPEWKAIPEIYEQIWSVDGFAPNGKEFRIGVVRGSDRGGDWSVTFVRNWFQTDRVFDNTSPQQFTNPDGIEVGRAGFVYSVPGDIEYIGVKFEKFTPFVTIRNRVQVGITYGGGIGSLRGTVTVLNRTGFLGDLISWEDGVYGTSKSVFPGGARACRPDGRGAPGGPRLRVGGAAVGGAEARSALRSCPIGRASPE